MSLPSEAQPLQTYEALTFHAHSGDDAGAPIFPQLSIGRENSLLRTILPTAQGQDWYHSLSIKDLQNIVPSQINNQATRIPQASSYSVNDPKLVEQLSQLHAQASGQQVDLVHAIQSSMPSSQPPANVTNPQSDMSLFKHVLEQQQHQQQPDQHRRGAPTSTGPISPANIQAITRLVSQNPRIAETMSFVDLMRLASQSQEQDKVRLASTPSQVLQALHQPGVPISSVPFSSPPAINDAVNANIHLPDPKLYPSAQANKSAAAATAAIRRQRRASMIKSSADESQISSQLPRSGPSKTISISAQSGSDLTKQVQQVGKRSRGKKQEDLDLSAEKKRLRAIRNRDSAKRHRERKQAYQTALEEEVNNLVQENEALKKLLQISTEGNKNADRLHELERLKKSIENPGTSMKDDDKDGKDKDSKSDQDKQEFDFFDDDKDKDVSGTIDIDN